MKLNDAINVTYGSANVVALYYNNELIWPTQVVAGIVTSNLILHLDASNTASYPGTGNTWFDLTDSNFDASLVNGASYSSSNNGIITFDGTNDSANISHNIALSLATTQVKTMQIWVKFDTLKADMVLIDKISSSFVFDGYTVRSQSNGSIRVVTNGTAISKSTTGAAGRFAANTWYFITVHTGITSTANSTRLYVDANSTPYIDTAHGSDGYSEANRLVLGCPVGGTAGTPLDGQIGAFYFYNKQLSTAEIEQNYNATKTRYGKT